MTIDEREICRYLRLQGRAPGAALEERIKAMREAALKAIRPARIWRRFDDPLVAGGANSETLKKHLAGCHAAYLVCTTIGADGARPPRLQLTRSCCRPSVRRQ